jgi:hypothetical protein
MPVYWAGPDGLVKPPGRRLCARVFMRLRLMEWFFLGLIAIGILPPRLACQDTIERPHGMASAKAIEWPAGPARGSVPSWAKNGMVRFARWDGGRLEVVKAILSGWPNFWPPDPNHLYAMDHWYDPRTIRLLHDAGINMIWVTFSNGFSNQTERLQQEELARYIAECHRQGIHVMAYESISNLFWQDMYENVPESRGWTAIGKDGKPVPYGAAAYRKLGYISRYMADLSNPGWQDYLRERVDLALKAGADGVDYDNNFARDITQLMNIYHMIYQYGSNRKKDFLLMGNFHSSTYVLNRLTNAMTTEDGSEPGIYDAQHVRRMRDKEDLLAADGGYLINNAGLFRTLDALSDSWKLNLVEDGRREFGAREAKPMSPQRQQLAMAEAMSFGAANELFVEDSLATALWNRDPEAIALWNAIANYNRFFAANEAYYTDTKSAASLAVVLDDTSRGVDLLNDLAARNVLFDVIYARDLTLRRLSRYSEVAVLTAETVSNKALAALEHYVREGGRLIVAGQSASLDQDGSRRPHPSFFGQRLGKGECVYYEQTPSLEQLAAVLRQHAKSKVPAIDAPAGVVYNVVNQPASRREIIHLLNYGPSAAGEIKVQLKKKYRSATLLSPDSGQPTSLTVSRGASGGEITIPSLKIYSMVVLTE